jgi:hypothetical protein
MIPEPAKLLIPPRVSAPGERMDGAINFHDQADGRSKEVRNPAPRERHLPAEGNTGLASGKSEPELSLRDGGKLAKRPSTGAEDG